MMMTPQSQNMGGGPLTRTELAIVLVAVVVLALIITSTLARAARKNGSSQPEAGGQSAIPTFLVPPQKPGIEHLTSSPGIVTGTSLPITIPGGISNTSGEAGIFSGITNSEPADWLRGLETGPQNPNH
jgi:hypothetical protein